MIDQTVPLQELTAGMARCVREWILPHLDDPMARTQAETLAALLDSLPTAFGAAALDAIRGDSEAARDLLRRLGEKVDEAPCGDIDKAMRENSSLKERLLAIADQVRIGGGDREKLQEVTNFFLDSMRRELDMVRRGTDFAAMTARESEARKS